MTKHTIETVTFKLGFVDVHLNHRIVAARDMKAAKLVSVLQ